MARLKNWLKQGNPNDRHYVALLEAEKSAFKCKGKQSKQEHVKNLYSQAVSLAQEGGFIQDEAIAYERYGRYLLNTANERWAQEQQAASQLKEACRYVLWQEILSLVIGVLLGARIVLIAIPPYVF